MTMNANTQEAESAHAAPVMQLVRSLRGLAQRQGHTGPPLDPMTQLCATLGHIEPAAACHAAIASVQDSQKRLQQAFMGLRPRAISAPAPMFATPLPASWRPFPTRSQVA